MSLWNLKLLALARGSSPELSYIKKEDKLIDGKYILLFCFKNGKENVIGYRTKKERDDDFEEIFNIFNNNGK